MKWGILIAILVLVALGIVKKIKKLFLIAALVIIIYYVWSYVTTGAIPNWFNF